MPQNMGISEVVIILSIFFAIGLAIAIPGKSWAFRLGRLFSVFAGSHTAPALPPPPGDNNQCFHCKASLGKGGVFQNDNSVLCATCDKKEERSRLDRQNWIVLGGFGFLFACFFLISLENERKSSARDSSWTRTTTSSEKPKVRSTADYQSERDEAMLEGQYDSIRGR